MAAKTPEQITDDLLRPLEGASGALLVVHSPSSAA